MPTAAADDRDEVVATTPDAVREQAQQRLKKRRHFKAQLFVYALVNVVAWGIWLVIGPSSHSWWPLPAFLTFFWGIGLVMHVWVLYLRKPITEEELRREKIRAPWR